MDEDLLAAAKYQENAEEIARLAVARLALSDEIEAVSILIAAAWSIGKRAHTDQVLARRQYVNLIRAHADAVERLGHFSDPAGSA